ncbi:beta-lactamase regulating signal transducer with metallopeptidase domain/predicted kinase [Pedobacter cryoconitis]|uniref:M56 family metallopeptidase n=1 Tax=Pedobacter cryoconitis TaxID=188932 RepID=UPI0016136D45|nr:M56 family metallopeptidase [Pedobacter cryoconitis]MBB6272773.1 beta-lactamase regulating signal transducer with metallopeptidase domain/predicted kinase [Pedobacter cryoconitis]
MEALLNNLIQATGWSILHSLWQAAFIYALLLPSQLHVFQLKAKTKYNLAYAANVVILICFAATFFSVFKWPAAQDNTIMSNIAPAYQLTHSGLAAIITRYAEKAFPFLVLLYSIGMIIQSFIVFKGYNKIQNLKMAARIHIPEEWNTLFEDLTKKLNISKHVSFHLSDHVNVPLVIGFFKPVILFPVALAAQMDMKHVEAILIHELSHIRRNDYIFNLIRTLIETILFFNPFVWLTGKFIDIEREHACDDLVVSLTSTPLTYAHALLQVELLSDKSSPLFALAATGNNQHLYQRIKRITDMKTSYMNSKQKLFAVTITVATIVSLAWISPAKSEKQQKNFKLQTNTALTASTVQLPADTGKKKLKRIIITKNNGADLSRRLDTTVLDKDRHAENSVLISGNSLNIRIDSIISPEVSVSVANFAVDVKDMVLASLSGDQSKLAGMTADLEKKGLELQKKFDSPEQKAKWEKFAAEAKAKYDNPKERAKLEKMAAEMKAKAVEMRAKYDTPAQREKIRKMQTQAALQVANIQKMVNSEEFKNRSQFIISDNIPNRIVILGDTEDQKKLKQTAEYQELKKKFDEDVEKLKARTLKKENQ